MSQSKKFYWLKLQDNFFDRDEIKIVENMPNGKDYIIFYMKLLLKSIKTEGKLIFREVIPYTPEMLSNITGTNVDTVRAAISLFTKLHLMQMWDDGTLFMVETQNMIGSETEWAKKKRLYRENLKKQEEIKRLEDNVQDKKDEVRQELDTELDTELEKDIDIDIDIDTKIDSNYLSFFNNNFHLITPFEKNVLESYEKDGLEASAIVLALEKAINKNKRSIEYVKGILNNWLQNNIRSIADVQASEKEFKRNKKKAGENSGSNREDDGNNLTEQGIGL
ncbi:phage replisome organizer N-terminal domain-containing protein [Clostridium botulinum]|uniref:phage replisome organizer N-terminal domain-containing protein n=1 Tax=Clostridium botulinum TaxID=1491 RepID=UPI00069FB7A1|nr:phage replisome organizer N-terminal domain-containing protein [Clostridium botulinum]QPW61554.1 phage replisome organizer N-terminal domain-containing protein [Clostridium botulinum]